MSTILIPIPILPPDVVDLGIERIRRRGGGLPSFRRGEWVRDRQTGNEGYIAAINRIGHAGQSLVLHVVFEGHAVVMPVTRLTHVDPPRRPMPPGSFSPRPAI